MPPARERIAVMVDGAEKRRWPRITGITLLVLLVLFFVGGGWFFSGMIRSDAMRVEESEPSYDQVVVGASEASITFAMPADPGDDLLSGEILGVRWENGYGLSGEVLSRSDDEIAKAFTQVTGGLPMAGTPVALEGDAAPPDPTDAGLEYREVAYPAAFGTFDAWLVEGDPATWAIFVHGRGATRHEAVRILPAFTERSITCLVIQYRNDPGAPATDDRLARFGATEWADLAGAVEYAIDNGAEDVVLVGFSMGGGIVMSYLYRGEETEAVAAAILDSPALELGAMVDERAAETDLPLLPFRVPGVLTGFSKWMAGLRFGADWGAMDYLDERVESLEKPVLVLHGTDDGDVPIALSRELADRRPDLVRLEEFRGAGHVRSWNHEPERYMEEVGSFLDGLLP